MGWRVNKKRVHCMVDAYFKSIDRFNEKRAYCMSVLQGRP